MKPDPLDKSQRALYSRLRRLRLLAWLAMSGERFVSAFGPAVLWGLLILALWLLNMPQSFGPIIQTFVFILFVSGLIYSLMKAWDNFQLPTDRDVNRRLEQDSALPHRPLETLDDRLANPKKPETRSLWSKGRHAAWDSLARLKIPRLLPVLSRKDPYAIRIAIILLFVIGVVVAGPDSGNRLYDGLTPVTWTKAETTNPVVLWVTPPAYTALPRLTIEGRGTVKDPVKIPEGSTIEARVSGGFGTPALILEDSESADSKTVPFKEAKNGHWHLQAPVTETDTIKIKQFLFTRLTIPIAYIEDNPPAIALKDEPDTLPRGFLEIPLTVEDDYGVTDLTMTMALSPEAGEPPMGTPVTETRAIMAPGGGPQDIKPAYDLTWHPWAGLPVKIALTVTDHKAQTATLPSIDITLPERSFYHPVARELVELRQTLIWTQSASRRDVSDSLQDILVQPSRYQNDLVAFLSLRTMISRLYYDTSAQAARDVIEQLWDTAIAIEDGNVALAARNLREKRAALEQLLNDDTATEEEIAKAMADLQQAMAEYFQEIHKEMQKRMAQGESMPMISPETLENVLKPEDLAAFLEQLQSEALSGDRDSAREMLSQLQQLMDSMDPSMAMQMPPQMEFMKQGINELQELIDKQKELREQTKQQAEKMRRDTPQTYPDAAELDDETTKRWQDGDMPPPPHAERSPPLDQTTDQRGEQDTINTQRNKGEQDALRFILGELMLKADENLGEIPENMQDAEQAMRQSADELGKNRPGAALPHQNDAIDHLEEAQNQMQQQMQQMMKQMQMMAFGAPLDPLGRPYSPGNDKSPLPRSDIKIPDEADRKRVREILEELREKSGEFNRPDYELDYFRRLMKQF